MIRARFFTYLLIPLLLFCSFFVYYQSQRSVTNLSIRADEIVWVGRSLYFDLLIRGDVKNPLWQTEGIDGDPRLTSYLYGMSLYPKYLKERESGLSMTDFLVDHYLVNFWYIPVDQREIVTVPLSSNRTRIEWDGYADQSSQIKVNMTEKYGSDISKGISLIEKARITSSVFLAMSCVLFYFIVVLLMNNSVLALLLSFFYGFSRLLFYSGLVATTESFLMFFSLLSLLWMYIVLLKQKKNYWYFIGLGFIIACTNQIKLNGIVLLLLFNAIFISLKVVNRLFRIPWKSMIIVNIIFVICTIAFNPSSYEHPIRFTLFQYSWTHTIAKEQQESYPGIRLITTRDRIENMNFYFFEAKHKSLDIQWLENFEFAETLKYLIIIGLMNLGYIIVLKIKSEQFIVHFSFLLTLLIVFLSLLWSYMLAWDRYLVQLVPLSWICVGYGVNGLFSLLKKGLVFCYEKTRI